MISCNNSTISYPLHNHVSVLTIGIILDGSVILTANDETKTYEKDDIFAILPYMPHSITAHDSYSMLSLCINKNQVGIHPIKTIQDNISLLLMQHMNMGKINHNHILQLLDRLNEAIAFYDLHTEYKNSYIHNLKEQLELYPEHKLSVGEMAQNAFTSKYHFIRSFKAEVGLTPHQFQIQNRIRKAKRLIHQTETITEVALATGFCDQSHFIKQFEKYVGLPPLTYKSSSKSI